VISVQQQPAAAAGPSGVPPLAPALHAHALRDATALGTRANGATYTHGAAARSPDQTEQRPLRKPVAAACGHATPGTAPGAGAAPAGGPTSPHPPTVTPDTPTLPRHARAALPRYGKSDEHVQPAHRHGPARPGREEKRVGNAQRLLFGETRPGAAQFRVEIAPDLRGPSGRAERACPKSNARGGHEGRHAAAGSCGQARHAQEKRRPRAEEKKAGGRGIAPGKQAARNGQHVRASKKRVRERKKKKGFREIPGGRTTARGTARRGERSASRLGLGTARPAAGRAGRARAATNVKGRCPRLAACAAAARPAWVDPPRWAEPRPARRCARPVLTRPAAVYARKRSVPRPYNPPPMAGRPLAPSRAHRERAPSPCCADRSAAGSRPRRAPKAVSCTQGRGGIRGAWSCARS